MGRWFLGMAIACLVTAAQASAVRPPLPVGVYEGGYVCTQGLTGLRLRVLDPSGGQQRARFEFGGNDGLPLGSYLVAVRAEDDGSVTLTPIRWVHRPPDYDMVGARLRIDGDELTGTIANPACGHVGLRRVD